MKTGLHIRKFVGILGLMGALQGVSQAATWLPTATGTFNYNTPANDYRRDFRR